MGRDTGPVDMGGIFFLRLCFWVGVPSQKQRMLLFFVPFCSIFRPVILLNRLAARNRYRAISLRPAMHQKCNFLGPCSCLIAKFSCFIRASRLQIRPFLYGRQRSFLGSGNICISLIQTLSMNGQRVMVPSFLPWKEEALYRF